RWAGNCRNRISPQQPVTIAAMEVDSWISGPPPLGPATRWLVMLIVAALAATPITGKLFSKLGQLADSLAKRPAFAVLTISLFAFFLSLAVSILVNFPEPV